MTASHRSPVSRSRTDVCEQEGAHLLGLAGEDLLDEIVDDVPVVAGEAGDEAGDVVAALHRQRRQLQCGDPALGARLQRGDVACGKVQAGGVVEVGRHLRRG